MKIFSTCVFSLIISGCALMTPTYYRSRSNVEKFSENSFVITYTGQANADNYTIGEYANYRTAQFVLSSGFRYYTIPTSKTVVNTAEIYVPPDVYYYFTGTQYNGRVSMTGYPISIGGGRQIYSTPTAVNLVKIVPNKNDPTKNIYDAVEVCAKIEKKYNLKC